MKTRKLTTLLLSSVMVFGSGAGYLMINPVAVMASAGMNISNLNTPSGGSAGTPSLTGGLSDYYIISVSPSGSYKLALLPADLYSTQSGKRNTWGYWYGFFMESPFEVNDCAVNGDTWMAYVPDYNGMTGIYYYLNLPDSKNSGSYTFLLDWSKLSGDGGSFGNSTINNLTINNTASYVLSDITPDIALETDGYTVGYDNAFGNPNVLSETQTFSGTAPDSDLVFTVEAPDVAEPDDLVGWGTPSIKNITGATSSSQESEAYITVAQADLLSTDPVTFTIEWTPLINDGEDDVPESAQKITINYTIYLDFNEAADTYRITYDLNGGSWIDEDMEDEQEVEADTEITLPAAEDVTKENSTFEGWKIDGQDEIYEGSTYTVTGDVTFIAQWKESEDNTGSGDTGAPDETPKPSTPPVSTPNPKPENPGDTVIEEEDTVRNEDGTYTTTIETESGITTVTDQDENGNVTSVEVTIPEKAIEDGNVFITPGTNSITGEKIGIPGNITSESSAPEITINLPESDQITNVTVELAKGTGSLGTVAMVEKNGEWVPVVDSVIDSNGNLVIPTTGGTVMIRNNARSFPDLNGNEWYVTEGAVAFVSARNIINGDANGNFDANGTVTRGMFSRMLWNLAGNPSTTAPGPGDVPADTYFSESAAWAASQKFMGVGSMFNPYDELTREQLVTILWRYAGEPEASTSSLNTYSDKDQVQDYALGPMAWAVSHDIVGVGSNLNPLSKASRAEMSAILERFLLTLWNE